jgi:SulP family sulfate permease
LTGAIFVILSVSLAALVFSGDAIIYRPNGIGLILFSATVIAGITALSSSLPGAIAGPQDSAAVILALAVTAVIDEMPASATFDEVYVTLFALIALASFMTGATFLLLGFFRLGNLIRFLPFPVIGGFLGGSGLLLVRGSVGVMTDAPLSLTDYEPLRDPDLLVKWLPGLIFAVVLLLLLRFFDHVLIVPGMLLVTVVVFYLVLGLTGTSISEATDQGWLIKSMPSSGLWNPIAVSDLADIDWTTVSHQLGTLLGVVLVSIITLLLNANGIEMAIGHNMNLNRELKACGFANLLASLGGGIAGSHYLGDTVLANRMGARGRMTGLLAAMLAGLVLVAGASLLSYFPNPLLGGLIFFLGLDFLATWVYDAWFRLTKAEYAVVILILVVINTVGFLEGVGLGLAVAVALFVVNYSRIDMVRYAVSGAQRQSNVIRPRLYQNLLQSKGDWLYILKLRGYIFFGTAHTLLARIQRRIEDPDRTTPHYVLLDFALVTGLDSSAVQSFSKLYQLADSREITLVFTGLTPHIKRHLAPAVFDHADSSPQHIFPTLDDGQAWCEDQMIAVFESVGLAAKPKTLIQQLRDVTTTPEQSTTLLRYFEERSVEAGMPLIHQGDLPQGLLFVERGQVTVWLENEDGPALRLRTMSTGTLIGEMGTYLDQPATATVIADQPGTVYFLPIASLRRMEQDDPVLAAALHRFIAQLMAERLTHTTEILQALTE